MISRSSTRFVPFDIETVVVPIVMSDPHMRDINTSNPIL